MRRYVVRRAANSIRKYATAPQPQPPTQRSSPTTAEYEKRVEDLKEYAPLRRLYPRILSNPTELSTLPDRYNASINLQQRQQSDEPSPVHSVYVHGRIEKLAHLGSNLHFIHITDGKTHTQVTASYSSMPEFLLKDDFRNLHKLLRVGDHIRVRGTLHEVERMPGTIGLRANQLPEIIAPSLHLIPKGIAKKEALARRRHVAMMTDPQLTNAIRIRHIIQQTMRSYFDGFRFTEVNTPILGFGASGAAARSFRTIATEMTNVDLRLRIAPELFLKRMIVGDIGPVYEIGPAFRNEGVDATHNPEFTMCEFYEPHANKKVLISRTRNILVRIVKALRKAHSEGILKEPPHIPENINFDGQWKTLEFIPTLESVIGERLDNPNFKFPMIAVKTRAELRSTVTALTTLHLFLKLPLPTNATLPRLLDSLGSHLIEPLCDNITWIVNHPVVMSPLAKSFRCSKTEQYVAARAELYINGVELMNCYEEENSPFDQRKKLVEQQLLRTVVGSDVHWDGFEDVEPQADGEEFQVDENYLEALEWGLPPTGGWGCGIDRLVMLFSGQKRIADVLPFGSLRNVVTMGKGHPDAVFETQRKDDSKDDSAESGHQSALE
ncbi:class II aaRS and biotin synthetase [Eremomyces bilateralis CBS 781.70]|uniref:Class II aaRS and biotin synthetase n=1 Tax=Eremomyces bilateralis CBS 781.70 TaxID=1392243 RepID=A0A6G1FY05_9PEZI|nr:class II aaRS and biotin synthetase [Eremomyces bilateralis CBS 781.70]KAF1810717.1 class II aaRS and biotin synthetase [Eremomyces bilateralis CBS 781.70]